MITQEEFDKLLPGDTVIAWDAFRPNGALALVAERGADGRLWLDWEGKGTGKSGSYPVECILRIVPRSITDTQRMDWLIGQIFQGNIHHDTRTLECLGLKEEELSGPGELSFRQLFRAAIDRRLAKTPEAGL